MVGVTGKLALWEALSDALRTPPEGIDLDRLAERARGQRSRLAALRRQAATEAFGG